MSDAAEFLRIFGSKFSIIEARVNSTLAERLTLNRIKELTRPTDRVFYFHSKGAPSSGTACRCACLLHCHLTSQIASAESMQLLEIACQATTALVRCTTSGRG